MSETLRDYIIIGAGTAGCLLANRLSARPDHEVLLIEAGHTDDYHWIHVPVGYLHCIGNPRTDWCYQTEAEPGLGGRSLKYPRGKTLGGSSSINGMIYMRGQAADYDQWAQITGDAGWSWQNVLPLFRQHENHHGGATDFHGAGGEWRVERQRLKWDLLESIAEAATQAGIPATPDFNRGDNEGVGYFEVNQRRGLRWSTARAFLRPTCHDRSNFELWTNAQVSRLLMETGDDGRPRCTGVEVWTGQEMVTVRARKEVILSAGAIGSPQILQRSGIGPAPVLQAAGVPVAHELPGVGANLQDHLQIRMVFKVQGATTLNTLSHSLLGKAKMGLQYMVNQSGPLSMAPSQLGAFTRSDPTRARANLQYHIQPLSLEAFGEPLHEFPAFTLSVCNLQPTSRGTVHIRSQSFDQAPAIAPSYLSTDEDRRVAIDAMRVSRRIAAQPALARFQPQEYRPGSDVQDDGQLADWAARLGTTIFHPVGTTAMGRDDDPMAVLDSHMRVRGMSGLRVVDAGAMPLITSGNTNSPTLMMAERAAALIHADA